jgi:hypothetical protein
METQLFDNDRLLFRAYPGEPVYALLSEGELDAAALRAVVEEELRRLRPSAVADTGYQHRDLDVLGEPVRVDVRNPANRELIRASDLEAALRETAGPLQAVRVAKLEPPQYRLATLLQRAEDGIPAAELQERLRQHIAGLAEVLGNDDLQREASAAEDPRAVFALVSALRDAGLAEEAEGVVRATTRLRRIRL